MEPAGEAGDILSNEYLAAAERRARRFSGAWTGTSGSLAADVMRCIRMIRALRSNGMEAEMEQIGGMSPEQMEAAWSAVRARHRSTQERIASHPAQDSAPRVLEEGNPKDIASTQRLPLDLWPQSATAMACVALLNGSLKYGRANWRDMPVKASVYLGAAQRHLAAWFDGEEADEEGVPHLSSVLASLAILVDAMATETLIDDRPTPGGYRRMANSLTPHVARLRALHAPNSGSP